MGLRRNSTRGQGGGAGSSTTPSQVITSRTLLGDFQNVVQSQTNTISQNWDTLVNDFDWVEVEVVGNAATAPNRFTRIIPLTGAWVTSTRSIIYGASNGFVTLTALNPGSGNFVYSTGGGQHDNVNLKFYGVRAVASEDTAEMNYQDIGNTRTQWGISTGNGSRTIDLHVPFANDDYVVNATAGFAGGEPRFAAVDPDTFTTTSFLARAFAGNNTNSAAPIHWIAVGVKP